MAVDPAPADTADPTAWHALSATEAAERLGVRPEHGLDLAEIPDRARRYGPNLLPEQVNRSAWLLFLAQFKSVLIQLLLLAAILAACVGDAKDAIVIFAVLVLNAIVGFHHEHRADQSLAALKNILPTTARVRRGGTKLEVAAKELVPGDVVLLNAGDRVPTDGRLFVTEALAIDESSLTGESQSVHKNAAAILAPDAPLAERVNIAHTNTMVTHGRGQMIVTATGVRTETGRVSLELAAVPEARTPLQAQLDQLGKRLGAIALISVGFFFAFHLLHGATVIHVILDSVALTVAAVPDGLPVVVTVTLALAIRRMARERAIVKRFASVETLGCTSVICSDKTGTLTLNQTTARLFFYRGRRFVVTGEGYQANGVIQSIPEEPWPDLSDLFVPLVVCNDSRVLDGSVIGDPMEGALLVLASKAGLDIARVAEQFPRVAEIPFDSGHKFMATFHRAGREIRLFIKGAPDVLLGHCASFLAVQEERPLDSTAASALKAEYRSLAERGLRGLLIASRTLPAADFAPDVNLFSYISNLTYLGLVGLMDPPRPEAREAISLCRNAGIAVKMITGDHRDTAEAVAFQLGLPGSALTGAELDAMDESGLAEDIERVSVFARVGPEHKVKIVRALQATGHVVAMTGDGVNDAPALKQADIGIAMGASGTEVGREAASMVLTDDNFATIVSAVRQGRILYDNILKFVRFQLSTTMGAMLTVFFAPLAGLPEPFNPIQILWVAMIMDGPPAVSLAFDAARPGIMHDPPRRRGEPILPQIRLARIVGLGIFMMAGTLLVFHYDLRTESEAHGATLAFTTFVLFQLFNVFNARAESETAFNRKFFSNRMLWLSLGCVASLQVVVVHWSPAQAIFRTVGLSPIEWCVAFTIAASILVLEEVRKRVVPIKEWGG